MGKLAKISCMGACLVLLVAGVAALRRQAGSTPVPRAEIPQAPAPSEPAAARITQQPTILQAKQADLRPGELSQTYSEQSPAAASPFAPPQPLLSDESLRDPELQPQPLPPDARLSPPATRRHTARGEQQHASHQGAPHAGAELATAVDQEVSWPLDRLPEVATAESVSEYVTRQNDSLWVISQQHYGSGEYYKALFMHNRGRLRRPDAIEAGVVLEIPPAVELRRRYPEVCPPDVLPTAEGTHLRGQKPLVR